MIKTNKNKLVMKTDCGSVYDHWPPTLNPAQGRVFNWASLSDNITIIILPCKMSPKSLLLFCCSVASPHPGEWGPSHIQNNNNKDKIKSLPPPFLMGNWKIYKKSSFGRHFFVRHISVWWIFVFVLVFLILSQIFVFVLVFALFCQPKYIPICIFPFYSNRIYLGSYLPFLSTRINLYSYL